MLLLSIGAVGSSASLRATDPLLPLLAQHFSTTAGTAAAVITAFSMAYGGLQILWGPLGDRLGKIRLIAMTTVISMLSTLGCALADALPLLIVLRFLSGATIGALIPLTMAWIGDVIAYDRRQAVLAKFLIGQIAGVAFGTAVSGYLGETVGWRAAFVLLALLYAFVSITLWLEMRGNAVMRQRPVHVASTTLSQGYADMLRLLRRPWVRVMLVTVFLEGGLFYGALSFAPLHLYERFNLGLGASGFMLTAFAAGGLCYALISRRLVHGFGERGLSSVGGALMGVGYLGFIAAPSVAWCVPALLVVGMGLYMLHSTLQVNATQMAPESRGAGVSLFAFFLFSGQSSGIWFAAQAVDRWGTTDVFYVAATALPILGWVFSVRLKTRPKLESTST